MKAPARILALVLIAVAATAAVARAAEPETSECLNLASCTSIPNTPWVVVPAGKEGFTEGDQGIVQAGFVLWRIDCPGGKIPAGRDYVPADPNQVVLVNALIPPFNLGITGSSAANFFGYWQGREPTSFRPLVGCVPKAATASASAPDSEGSGGALRLRAITRTLHPGQVKTFVHRCAKGERLVDSQHGVAFYRQTPPTRAELKGLEVARSNRRGRVVVRVRTDAKVGGHERVEIQIHALCRASA